MLGEVKVSKGPKYQVISDLPDIGRLRMNNDSLYVNRLNYAEVSTRCVTRICEKVPGPITYLHVVKSKQRDFIFASMFHRVVNSAKFDRSDHVDRVSYVNSLWLKWFGRVMGKEKGIFLVTLAYINLRFICIPQFPWMIPTIDYCSNIVFKCCRNQQSYTISPHART